MIFVTGGTGFIGAHFLYHLLNKGEEVLALRRHSSDVNYVKKVFSTYTNNYKPLLDKLTWAEGDIEDYYLLLRHLDQVNVIFHLAALVSFDPGDRYKMLATNVRGTSNIVNAALEKGVPHLVYLSSVGALDPVKKEDYTTESNFANNPKRASRYSASKFKSELVVWRGIEEGLNALIVNPSVVLGPAIPKKGTGKILTNIQKGLRYYPAGITGFVDVRDVCKATLSLYNKQIFNERFILSEGNYSYKKILQLLSNEYGNNPPEKILSSKLTSLAWKLEWLRSKIFGGKPRISKEIHNSAHNQVYFSNEKVKERLQYEFIPIEQTIKDTVAYS